MTEQLKPVAWSWECLGLHVTASTKHADDLRTIGVELTPLYAIPDGYAVMPVDLIEFAAKLLDQYAASKNISSSLVAKAMREAVAAYQQTDGISDIQARGNFVDEEGEMSEWISVEERLPALNDSVLAYRKGRGVGNFYLISEYKWLLDGWSFQSNKEFDDITHWMPLPEPPEKAND